MAKQIILFTFLFGLCAFDVFSQSKKVSLSKPDILCNSVSKIKQLPHHDESGVDAVYDALAQAGESVVPCLIEKITDTSVMKDPRCPTITKTRVGDVAYFVLVRITKIGFIELFPADVQGKYKTEGVYAYHDFIEQKGNRKQLQSRLRNWFQQKQSSKA